MAEVKCFDSLLDQSTPEPRASAHFPDERELSSRAPIIVCTFRVRGGESSG